VESSNHGLFKDTHLPLSCMHLGKPQKSRHVSSCPCQDASTDIRNANGGPVMFWYEWIEAYIEGREMNFILVTVILL